MSFRGYEPWTSEVLSLLLARLLEHHLLALLDVPRLHPLRGVHPPLLHPLCSATVLLLARLLKHLLRKEPLLRLHLLGEHPPLLHPRLEELLSHLLGVGLRGGGFSV